MSADAKQSREQAQVSVQRAHEDGERRSVSSPGGRRYRQSNAQISTATEEQTAIGEQVSQNII